MFCITFLIKKIRNGTGTYLFDLNRILIDLKYRYCTYRRIFCKSVRSDLSSETDSQNFKKVLLNLLNTKLFFISFKLINVDCVKSHEGKGPQV